MSGRGRRQTCGAAGTFALYGEANEKKDKAGPRTVSKMSRGSRRREVSDDDRGAPRIRPMASKRKTAPAEPAWMFLTNHAHVLLLIAQDPEIRLRDVAEQVGITERAVQRIVADLEAE